MFVLSFSFYFQAKADNSSTSSATSTLISTSTSTPASATSTQGSVLGLQMPAIPPLISQIDQAKTLLSSITLNHALSPVYKNVKNKKTGKTSKIISKYNLSAKDIALAILDPSTNQIVTTVGMQTGQKMSFSDPAVDVSLKTFNGVNSKFTINRPAGGTILALKYLITGPESGSKANIENALNEAVYVPYSAGLSDPSVIAYGEDYLNNIIHEVTADLQVIPSNSIPGEMITEAIPPAMIKALVYAEHTDTAAVLTGNVQDTINQLNILFATNQGDAYKYSVSTAGARGIAQFIPSTYQSLVQRHPEAGLIPDFVAGMSDHKNSIKAMYLLLDDYAGAVRVKAAQSFAIARVFEYGAASYNGGTTRVANALNTFGNDWNADHSGQINSLQATVNNLKSQIKKTKDKKTKTALQSQYNTASSQLANLKSASLKNETVNYLQKIYKVITVFNDQVI